METRVLPAAGDVGTMGRNPSLRNVMLTMISAPGRRRPGILEAARPAALVLCVLAAACESGTGPPPDADHELLFVSTRGDPRQVSWISLEKDIFRASASGTAVENVTGVPSVYRALALSPEGRRIAFGSTRDGCGIWTMSVDGTGARSLTAAADRCNHTPRWSPDGSWIAFTTSRELNWSVYVMSALGATPRNVARALPEDGWKAPLGWTPDGRVVLQHWQADGSVRAYLASVDATTLVPFAGAEGDHSPVWSPDGSRIAFVRPTAGGASLHVMNADGSAVRRLTEHAGDDLLTPVSDVWDNHASPWSPDGSRLAFVNAREWAYAVYSVRADGTGLVRVTDHHADTRFDGWSPDGRITFSAGVAGPRDVYVVGPDGSGLTNLTNGAAHDTNALWVPRR
jgi:Tol biopolymer transport system component